VPRIKIFEYSGMTIRVVYYSEDGTVLSLLVAFLFNSIIMILFGY